MRFSVPRNTAAIALEPISSQALTHSRHKDAAFFYIRAKAWIGRLFIFFLPLSHKFAVGCSAYNRPFILRRILRNGRKGLKSDLDLFADQVSAGRLPDDCW